MFSSLRFRLWLSYALLVVTALCVVAIILFIYLLRNPLLYRQTTEKLKAVQAVVMESVNSSQTVSITQAAQQASKTFNVRILLFSQDKQLIFDTNSDKRVLLPFPETRLFLRNSAILRDGKNAVWLYSMEQLPDHTYLVVASRRPRVSLLNIFANDLLSPFLQSGSIALLLSLVVAFFFAGWIANPLQKVVVAARAMPSAEAKPVDVRGPHEVQELTRAFNSMIIRTQASQKSQRDFIANVSHELKTPLTSIQGFAQALLDGTADSNEARQKAATVIYDESGRMHRMVLDLLDLARLDAGTADITMSPVNMSGLLKAVAEKFSPQLQRAGINIRVDVAENLQTVTADGDRLAQVFTNLVDNALKFTPRGGLVSLRASAANGEMLVTVSDTGRGISTEALPHIFDRFYQSDTSRTGGDKHGAGLGLAIAYEIVQAHGGRISVRSRLGEGTSFDVFLPLMGKSATTIVRRK